MNYIIIVHYLLYYYHQICQRLVLLACHIVVHKEEQTKARENLNNFVIW